MDTLFWQDRASLTEEQKNKHGSLQIPARPAGSVSPLVGGFDGEDARIEHYDKDILALEYPNEADAIREYRAYGVDDVTIRAEMADREAEYLSYGVPPQDIDEHFGRTAQTKTEAVDQTRRQRAGAISLSMGMPIEEADKIIALAGYTGISPNLLLMDKDLRDTAYKTLERQGVKMSEGAADQFWNAVKAQQLNKDKYAAFAVAIAQGRDPRNDAYILDINAQLEKLGAPLFQTTFQKMAAGSGQFLTQQEQGLEAGFLGTGIGVPVGAVIGFLLSGPAGVGLGVKFGGGTGFKIARAAHASSQEICMAYEEFLNLDVDPKLARIFAVGFGSASGALEYVQMDLFIGMFKNAGLQKRILSVLVENGIDFAKEITQEVAQRAVIIAGREILKYVSGQENATLGEMAGDLGDEAVGAALSFGLPTAGATAFRAGAQYIGNRSAGMKNNKTAKAELDADMQKAAALRQKIAAGEDGKEFVFVPKGDVEALFQSGQEAETPGGERQKERVLNGFGIDAETYEAAESGDEIAISAELFDASPIQSDNVRRGVHGETAREELARIQANIDEKLGSPLYADTKEAEAALQVKNEVVKLAIDAGADPSVAVQGASLWASHAVVMAREMDMPVKDAMRLIVQRATPELEDVAARGDLVGYKQAAMYRSRHNTFGEYYDFVSANQNNRQQRGKSFYQHVAQDGAVIDIPFDNVTHMVKDHGMTSAQIEEILGGIDNGIADASFKQGETGKNTGIPVNIKIKTSDGWAGGVIEFIKNGRVLLITAFNDSEANIDDWIDKNGSRTHIDATNNQLLPGSRLSLQSIQNSLGIVKQDALFQQA